MASTRKQKTGQKVNTVGLEEAQECEQQALMDLWSEEERLHPPHFYRNRAEMAQSP